MSLRDAAAAAPAEGARPGAGASTAAGGFDQLVREEYQIQAASLPLKEMPSCMNLFDKWVSCFALGPQARAVYRYGSMQDCRDKLDDFKFCLTIKGAAFPEQRRQIWLQRKAEKVAAKRLQSSSEDVWEMRRDPVVHEYFREEPPKS